MLRTLEHGKAIQEHTKTAEYKELFAGLYLVCHLTTAIRHVADKLSETYFYRFYHIPCAFWKGQCLDRNAVRNIQHPVNRSPVVNLI